MQVSFVICSTVYHLPMQIVKIITFGYLDGIHGCHMPHDTVVKTHQPCERPICIEKKSLPFLMNKGYNNFFKKAHLVIISFLCSMSSNTPGRNTSKTHSYAYA